MTGIGRSGGAGTLVNAIATGKGAAFGIGLSAEARIDDATTWTVTSDDRVLARDRAKLATESAREACRSVRTKHAHKIAITSNIPAECGLKSSSAVSVAVIRATLDAHDLQWSSARILTAAARAGIRSGTSITGAYDDAAACLLGGAVVTDNRRFRLLRHGDLPRGVRALVRVPPGRLKTAAVRNVDFRSVRALVADAWAFARKGEYDRAMILNSAAYAGVLGHDTRFTFQALREGAWSAGLSGKGPAEIALGSRDVIERLQRSYPDSLPVGLRRKGAR